MFSAHIKDCRTEDRASVQVEVAMKAGEGGSVCPQFMLAWCALVLTIVVLCPIPHAVAQEPGESAPGGELAANSNKALPPPKEWYEEPTKNLLTLALGGAIWPSLGNKEFGTTTATADSPGQVSSLGFAFETAYHRHIAHWERGDLYLGGEFGAFLFDNKDSGDTTQSSTSPTTTDLDARVWYAGPSIKFMMGQGRLKYFLGAGGGYYQLELSESVNIPPPNCTSIAPCFDTKRSLNKSAIGGYVSLGVDLAAWRTESGWEWRLRLEDKVHLVNFGSLDSFAPGAGNLSGPINVIQIGVVMGF
jgi:hypothetical protein